MRQTAPLRTARHEHWRRSAHVRGVPPSQHNEDHMRITFDMRQIKYRESLREKRNTVSASVERHSGRGGNRFDPRRRGLRDLLRFAWPK